MHDKPIAVISNDYLKTSAAEIDQLSSDEFRETIEALTVAPFRLCSAAAAIMKK